MTRLTTDQHQGDLITIDPLIARGFEKIQEDMAFLKDCFREVLQDIGLPDLCALLDTPADLQALELNQDAIQLLSVQFQLLNLVEENVANQMNRQRQSTQGDAAVRGSWAQVRQRTAPTIEDPRELLKGVLETPVDIVFTAHPTEAKKPSILDQHRELYLHLFALENRLFTRRERARISEDIKDVLERLWRTGEIPLEKPSIESERENILYYLKSRLPDALRAHDRRFLQTFQELGVSKAELLDRWGLPKVRFGMWVGGDRDGHPFVTPEVTEQTLGILRHQAWALVKDRLLQLASRLPLSKQSQVPSQALQKRLEFFRQRASQQEGSWRMYAEEPWREYVWHMAQQFNAPDAESIYPRREHLESDLDILEESLRELRADRLVHHELLPLRRHLEVFGFHMARLDIRQNSAYHEKALIQLFRAGGCPEAEQFGDMDELERQAFLNQELTRLRPLASPRAELPEEAAMTVRSLSVIADHLDRHGPEGLGFLIVSMTRQVSDLLILYVLCREAGILREIEGELVCPLPVTPLFETLDDLKRSSFIMQAFMDHPLTRSSLGWWSNHFLKAASTVAPADRAIHKFQPIMLGYSDSNKDAGIFAGQWQVRKAQTELLDLGDQLGVVIQFFHGRGGTVSRGAGPADRFLEALPPRSLKGGIRLTEQGETIAQKYSNILTGSGNLELWFAGAVTGRAMESRASIEPGFKAQLDEVASKSQCAYQALVQREGFEVFYQQATPVDLLQKSRMGSRPASRRGMQTVQDMRAIPWVFSWNQARFYVPGWFGVGTGLQSVADTDPTFLDLLTEKIPQTPFLEYVLVNVESSLESADVEIMRDYASLVVDGAIADRFLEIILEEYQRTRQLIQRVMSGPLQHRRPRFYSTLHARDLNLKMLHKHQIKLLQAWREKPTEALLTESLLVVNAIASGQRTTG